MCVIKYRYNSGLETIEQKPMPSFHGIIKSDDSYLAHVRTILDTFLFTQIK
jgi:hypothetical protein